LQTHDHPAAFISVKTDGWRVGPREILEKLEDAAQADDVDPKSYSFRLYVHMETGDPRYLHLNTGMWVASGIRRGTESKSSNATQHDTFALVTNDYADISFPSSHLRRLPRSLNVKYDHVSKIPHQRNDMAWQDMAWLLSCPPLPPNPGQPTNKNFA
jgi:hypothetical protein